VNPPPLYHPSDKKKTKSSGSGLSQKQRDAIEARAMAVALKHYKKSWDRVVDNSKNKKEEKQTYDLECWKENEHIFAEVKGTSSKGETVTVTYNQVEKSKYKKPRIELFILHNIKLSKNKKKPIAKGGVKKIISNWKPRDCDLKPINYKYTVSKK